MNIIYTTIPYQKKKQSLRFNTRQKYHIKTKAEKPMKKPKL